MSASRDELVEVVIRSGISDPRLIEAFRATDRAAFVSSEYVAEAYEDGPLPIPHDQVTTQPSLTAAMIEALDLQPTSRVLEVGTGYGFQTALLAHLADNVTSVERWPDLAARARRHLTGQGITNVDVHVGDGSLGWPPAAPFDAILVSAAFPDVPHPLAEQLVDGGRLVQPIGPGGEDMVALYCKTGGILTSDREVIPARFVRLIGAEAFPEDRDPVQP